MQKENDTLLVAKLREGNKFAFEALYEKYSARLYNTIVLLVYDKSLAKDITQSSFMTIWEKRSNLDTEKSFPAYLCTIHGIQRNRTKIITQQICRKQAENRSRGYRGRYDGYGRLHH